MGYLCNYVEVGGIRKPEHDDVILGEPLIKRLLELLRDPITGVPVRSKWLGLRYKFDTRGGKLNLELRFDCMNYSVVDRFEVDQDHEAESVASCVHRFSDRLLLTTLYHTK